MILKEIMLQCLHWRRWWFSPPFLTLCCEGSTALQRPTKSPTMLVEWTCSLSATSVPCRVAGYPLQLPCPHMTQPFPAHHQLTIFFHQPAEPTINQQLYVSGINQPSTIHKSSHHPSMICQAPCRSLSITSWGLAQPLQWHAQSMWTKMRTTMWSRALVGCLQCYWYLWGQLGVHPTTTLVKIG